PASANLTGCHLPHSQQTRRGTASCSRAIAVPPPACNRTGILICCRTATLSSRAGGVQVGQRLRDVLRRQTRQDGLRHSPPSVMVAPRPLSAREERKR